MDSGRVVLVTGAARGLGRGIAEAFARQGDTIVVADRDAEGVASAAAELNGVRAVVDLTDAGNVARAVAAVLAEVGRIDVLVNNAGIVAGHGLITDADVAVLDAALAVNVRGTLLMTREVGRAMKAAKAGVIVNVSSVGGRKPTVGLGHYEMTKAAVDAMTRSLAVELAPYGIRANAVAPGPVRTPMTAGLVADPQALSAWESRIPLGRIAEVSQVAPAVVFLASTAASHITGVSLAVDGGQLLA